MINAVKEGENELTGEEKTMIDSFEKCRDAELKALKAK